MTLQISMTPGAIDAAREFRRAEPAYAALELRVYLSGKGCDGFDYGVSFDSRSEGDLTFQIADDVTLLCDDKSIEFLAGSVVDWVDDERGRGFLVENPNHKKFRGKFYKRASWKNRHMPVTSDSPQ